MLPRNGGPARESGFPPLPICRFVVSTPWPCFFSGMLAVSLCEPLLCAYVALKHFGVGHPVRTPHFTDEETKLRDLGRRGEGLWLFLAELGVELLGCVD